MLRQLSVALILFLITDVSARSQASLRNTGEALRVPFTCAEDELQSVGLLCTEDEPCPIYLELNSVAVAGKKIFLAGNLHSTSATLSSFILASDDTGSTWKEPAARLRGASLDQLEFYDFDHGWAAGELQYPLPRDPFFLITTDGGATWRKQLVTEDGGPGAVHRFWFDSAQHGELVVDAGRSASRGGRYLAWESETGGESWMLRGSTGEAPRIKRAPADFENTDFRLHATANGQAYQVEKRLGEKWETVASFSIEIANCKLKAPEAKEPSPNTFAVEASQAKDYVEELRLGGDGKPVPARTPAKAPVKKKSPVN